MDEEEWKYNTNNIWKTMIFERDEGCGFCDEITADSLGHLVDTSFLFFDSCFSYPFEYFWWAGLLIGPVEILPYHGKKFAVVRREELA